MDLSPVLSTASATKDGILLQVIDGPAGIVYQKFFPWEDLKIFLQEHGKAMPIGEFLRVGNGYCRDIQEMDPDKPD